MKKCFAGCLSEKEGCFMLDESAVGLSVEQDFSYTWRDPDPL